ncbi:MAG: hypothetical protein JST93_27200 [Acidobacteria bacterium]|nr:hypothetical protein [Acidobacteriota bacterium]
MHLLWMLFLPYFPAFPQPVPPFRSLATNFNGDRVYFISERPIRGTNQPWHDKIFLWSEESGLQLFEARPASDEDYFRLFHISLSADASTSAVSAMRQWRMPCLGCGINYQTKSRLSGAASLERTGLMHLSANGRYALIEPRYEDGNDKMGLLDTASGAFNPFSFSSTKRLLTHRCPCGGRKVANDGTAAYYRNDLEIALSAPNGAQIFAAANRERAIAPMLDESATTLVYQSSHGMVIRHLDTQSEVEIEAATPAGISADGTRVLYLFNAQLHIVDCNGANAIRLTQEPSGIIDATLSGDGRIAFFTTATGNVFRIHTDTGTILSVVSSPVRLSLPQTVAAGSLYRVLTQVTKAPEGLALRIGGRAIALYNAPSGAGEEVWAQIPWDLAAGRHKVEWVVPTDLLLDPQIDTNELDVRATAPSFLPGPGVCAWQYPGPPNLLAFHDAFDRAVAYTDPVRPGERIHVFLAGLGGATQSVATSQPAPTDPQASIQSPISCAIHDADTINKPPKPVEVLSAVLAPALVGLYQVALRLPANLSGQGIQLACTQSGETITGSLPSMSPFASTCDTSSAEVKW